MKKYSFFITLFLLMSCSSTRMIDSWRNNEYVNYQLGKVLIIGVTQNLTGRILFEEQLKKELNKRGIQADESYDIFEQSFTSSKQTEEDIQKEVDKLLQKRYNTIIISAVKGVDERTSYSGDGFRFDYYYRRFHHYYYLYQDVYFERGYYNKYKVYNIETSLYNLKDDSEKSLVWVASYDVVDPKKISSTVNRYVTAIINSLEEEGIIPLR